MDEDKLIFTRQDFYDASNIFAGLKERAWSEMIRERGKLTPGENVIGTDYVTGYTEALNIMLEMFDKTLVNMWNHKAREHNEGVVHNADS